MNVEKLLRKLFLLMFLLTALGGIRASAEGADTLRKVVRQKAPILPADSLQHRMDRKGRVADTAGQAAGVRKPSVSAPDDTTGRVAVQPAKEMPDSLTIQEIVRKKPHSPHKATIMAMILPGSGQIYNGQWWKVPILYGGVAADMYGVIWNNKRYAEYRDAFVEYTQFLDNRAKDPEYPYPENPAWDKIPKGFDVKTDPYLQTSSGQEWFRNTLNNRKTSFKRNRDLCYIVMGAIYAINIIDATVFAHFYDFEIDDNLSFNISPTSSYSPLSGGSVGLCLTFKF